MLTSCWYVYEYLAERDQFPVTRDPNGGTILKNTIQTVQMMFLWRWHRGACVSATLLLMPGQVGNSRKDQQGLWNVRNGQTFVSGHHPEVCFQLQEQLSDREVSFMYANSICMSYEFLFLCRWQNCTHAFFYILLMAEMKVAFGKSLLMVCELRLFSQFVCFLNGSKKPYINNNVISVFIYL